MSHLDQLPAVAVDFAVALLLPLVLPFLSGDPAAAEALARRLLGAYRPVTERELQFVGEAVGYNLKGLTLLAASATPNLTAGATDTLLRRACSLSRLGHQAQRRLDELRGVRRTGRRATPEQADAPPDAGAPDAPEPAASPHGGEGALPAGSLEVARVEAADGATENGDICQPASSPDLADVSEDETPAPKTEVEQARIALNAADTLLYLMKAHFKGAPPAHSPAARQIKDQQRVVETARMKLAQARRRAAQSVTQPIPVSAAA